MIVRDITFLISAKISPPDVSFLIKDKVFSYILYGQLDCNFESIRT